jgi:hypothetical protein
MTPGFLGAGLQTPILMGKNLHKLISLVNVTPIFHPIFFGMIFTYIIDEIES